MFTFLLTGSTNFDPGFERGALDTDSGCANEEADAKQSSNDRCQMLDASIWQPASENRPRLPCLPD